MTTALQAQIVETGNITGEVRDNSGAVIPKVQVNLRNAATGLVTGTVTDSQGIYVSPPLDPGDYNVEFEAAGFGKVQEHIRLEVGQRTAANAVLAVGKTTETVTVEASTQLLETETSEVTNLRTESEVKDLPLNGRNFAELVGLGAGVVPAQTQLQNIPYTQQRGPATYAVNGLRYQQNRLLLDGVGDNDNHNGLGVVVFPPVDAILEFTEETLDADARYGRTDGGTINVLFKSGTNRYHGDVFEYVRNTALIAKGFLGTVKPGISMNEFGGTFGGPLFHAHNNPQTFFFADYSGQRLTQGINNGNLSVPDYSVTTVGGVQGYDLSAYEKTPGTGNITNLATGLPYANNFIPASDPNINNTGANILNFYHKYAAPNVTGNAVSGNYFVLLNKTVTEDAFDVKIDHRFRDSDNAFLRYSQSRDDLLLPGYLPNPLVGGSIVGPASDPAHQLVLNETHIFSPTLVNTARVGWSRFFVNATNFDRGLYLPSPTNLNIPGVERGNLNSDGLPAFTFSGYTGIGDNGNNPTQIGTNNYQVDDDLNIVRGKHSINVGAELVRLQYDMFQTAYEHGAATFSGAYSGNVWADLLFGAPKLGNYAYQLGTQGFRQTSLGIYAQDNYKPTSRLTLNIGLRYENFLGWPWNEVNNKMYQFLPSLSTTQLFQVGTNGIPSSGVNGQNHNFEPRVGVAYHLLDKTVVHAGYGLYDAAPNVTNSSWLGNNVPFVDFWSFTNGKVFGAASGGIPFNFIGPNSSTVTSGFQHTEVTSPSSIALGTPVYAVDPNAKTPYSEQWHLNLQQQLTPATTVTVSYVGTHGLHQDALADINAGPNISSLGANRPYPTFGQILQLQTRQSSNYNALQVTGERRAKDFSFLASYTYSHALDENSSSPGAVSDPFNPRYDYGNSDYDTPNRVVGSASYNLPFHDTGRYKYAAEGWQLNAIFQYFDGLPFSVTTGSPGDNLTNRAQYNPANGPAALSPSQRALRHWFNTAAFSAPAPGTWGNSGRNILQGPSTKNVDFSVFKNFQLAEGKSLQIRSEFFNVLNIQQFNNPASSVAAPGTIGTITAEGSPQTFQRIPRQIQLAAKFYF